ncbi:c-type cytochrome [Methylorubrum thiocyanatum]|uniref:c-type cytochrome n=1 Tax=Methylorubrum thiocyanatum TaxID=47958 RepID=UPI0035C7D83F
MRRLIRNGPPVAALITALILGAGLSGCGNPSAATAEQHEQAVALIRSYGCGGCHDIPGIAGANGVVGPSLHGIGRRVFIAGMLRNTQGEMVRWLRDSQGVVPGNAMPNMGLGEDEARAIAAYLATLR